MSPEQRTQAQPARIEILLEILLYIDATALARRRCQATGARRFVQRRTAWRALVCGVRQLKYKSRLSRTCVCRLLHRIGMRVGASSHGPPTRIRVEDSHEHRRPADRHRVRVVAVEPDHGLKTDPGASIAPGTATLEDQRMNVPALLTMAVLVGWLATLITHAETDDVSLPDFAIAVCAAALAGGLLAPVLGVSATGGFGLTLRGPLFSWARATLLLGPLNLLRLGSLRRNRRAGASLVGTLADTSSVGTLADTGHKV